MKKGCRYCLKRHNNKCEVPAKIISLWKDFKDLGITGADVNTARCQAFEGRFDNLKDARILIIDIETTGFLQKGGEIVEIGIVELNIQTGEKQILFDSMVREREYTVEELEKTWICENGYIKPEEIIEAPLISEKIEKIQLIVDAYPNGSTAFNNKFDFLESRGIKFGKKLGCPMKLSTDICKIPSPRGYGFKWPNCEEAYKFYFPKSNFVEKHRGADDAFHEADIVFEMMNRDLIKL